MRRNHDFKDHVNPDFKSDINNNTVKKKQIICQQNRLHMKNTRTHSVLENGINEGSITKRARIKILKRIMNQTSFTTYNIKPDDYRLHTDVYVKLIRLSEKDVEAGTRRN